MMIVYYEKNSAVTVIFTNKSVQPCGTGIASGHYANISMQYTAIYCGCKKGNFQMKKNVILFHIFY